MQSLLKQLERDFTQFRFTAGVEFCWSPKNQEITYNSALMTTRTGPWTTLHELGHALLDHTTYTSDLELIHMETAAWEEAKKIGTGYGYEISEEYIQDCMDTYRDWLHQRSACPKCQTRSLQHSPDTYRCFNCQNVWTVSTSRFCRPYRRSEQKKTSPPKKKAMFI